MSGSMHSDMCNVYYCHEPIQQTGSAIANVLSYFGSWSGSACGDSREKHWLAVFDYGEDMVTVCEADMDYAGNLSGRKYWRKRTVFNNIYSNKRHLGKHRVPEARIHEAMRKTCNMGPYHPTNNNFQIARTPEVSMPAPS
ncbi:uncharacterized protein [Dermacentor andersoni]|uniref:uncharacterized protein isoform X2 n=1 Tax=Dermacentor andersoni TaxID=34620 RepID=UPI0024169D91|nr:uncharacterized protein LOC126517897 isoform X2 [Dermacentor andersoni]